MIESEASDDSKLNDDENLNDFCLSKLRFDSVKDEDLKTFFEVLMVNSQNRTVADLDTLVKILMHIEPIKKMNNISAVYLISKKLTLSKYKSKQIIFENVQQSEQFYIILNGKIALYKKADEYFDSDEVISLGSGSCFGKIYAHSSNYIALAMQETLIAVLNRKQNHKIPVQLSFNHQKILEKLIKTELFKPFEKNKQLFSQIAECMTINKLPLGSYIIRESEIPKALFFVIKGLVKKSFMIQNAKDSLSQSKQLQTRRYTEGNFFPVNLVQALNYNIIAESICEIIVIPKKALKLMKRHEQYCNKQFFSLWKGKGEQKMIGSERFQESFEFFQMQLSKKKEWKNYRENIIKQVIKQRDFNKKCYWVRS